MALATMLMCAHVRRGLQRETQDFVAKFKDGFEAGLVAADLFKKDDEWMNYSLEDDIMALTTTLMCAYVRHGDGFEAGLVAADLFKNIREGGLAFIREGKVIFLP